LTGLEPATSAVTGRHANQLRYRALHMKLCRPVGDPNGIRTRAAAVKGRCPRPLNDGAMTANRIATDAQAYVAIRLNANRRRSATTRGGCCPQQPASHPFFVG